MFRRVAIFGLVVSLVAFAPLPLSACALLAALPGDCSRPAPQSECADMKAINMSGMPDAPTHLTAPAGRSCCQVTGAPLPEAQAKAAVPQADALHAVAIAHLNVAVPVLQPFAIGFSFGHSPPERQPLLCVFLI